MKSPGLAMLWESFARQRWLTLSIVGDFAVLVVLTRIVPREWLEIDMVRFLGLQFEIWFFLGLTALFCPVVNQPRTGQEGYPSRMFLYPISTFRLVAWPMLFGITSIVLGWIAMVLVVLNPIDIHPPLAMGALGAAAGMAWIQALNWWPFRSVIARLVVSSATIIGLTTAVVWPLVVWESQTAVGLVLLSAYLATAFGVALKGVALDRRGERHSDREASPLRERFDRLEEAIAGRGSNFTSAAQAQSWYEWRTKGAMLVILVVGLVVITAIVLAIFSAFVGRDPVQVRIFFSMVLFEPVYICWIMGTAFAKDEWLKKSLVIPPFVATRPMTSGQMAGIKLRAAATSLLAAYACVLLLIPLWLVATGNLETLGTILRPIIEARGVGIVVLLAILGLVVVVTFSWKGMIGAMLPILTGRPWVLQVLTACFIPVVIVGVLIAVYVTRDSDRIMLWTGRALVAMPWVLGMMLGLKVIVGAVAFRAALRRRMISPGMLVGSAALWGVVAASVFGPVAILLRPAEVSLWLTLALGSALIPPFGRLALAPLALDWNRHQ